MLEKRFDDVFEELEVELIETRMCSSAYLSPAETSDLYGYVLNFIVNNLISICLYPNNPNITHWKERIKRLCCRFIDLRPEPLYKVAIEHLLKDLTRGIYQELNVDYGNLLNRFKTVSEYNLNRYNSSDMLKPYKPYKEAYEDNKEKVIECVNSLTYSIARHRFDEVVEYINNF